MDIRSAKTNIGLSVSAETTSSEITGPVTIGSGSNQTTLTACDVAYAVRAKPVATATLVLNTATNVTSASTAWGAGTAQVETATVTAGSGITSNGNIILTVTAAGMTGSPKAITLAVTTAAHTTATLIATAMAAALNADADYSALFTATTSTNTVITTRKVNSLGMLPANDATLNIAIPGGLGVTAAASSADTTAGVASTGTYIVDGDAKDFEGVTIPTIVTLKAIAIKCTAGEVDLTSANETATLTAGETRVYSNNSGIPSALAVLTFTAVSASDITVTVIGSTT